MQFVPLQPEEILALVLATSFAAGLNVYATLATLGLLARAGLIGLPEPLGPIADWWVIGISLTLFVVEFFADKVPAFDLIWNALHTFVRVPAGALLAWGAATEMSLGWQVAVTVLGGIVALAAHGAKSAMRVAVTPSPEPVSNTMLSLGEDLVAVFLTWFVTQHPFIAAAVVVGMLLVIVLLARWIWRALAALFRGASRRRPTSNA